VVINVVPTDDFTPEATKTLILTLQDHVTYNLDPLAAKRTATVNIMDNEPIISLIVADNSTVENSEDTGLFRIHRTGSTFHDLTVTWTMSGTASGGTDYQLLIDGTVVTYNVATIPAGSSDLDIVVAGRDPNHPLVTQEARTAIMTLGTQPQYTLDPLAASRTGRVYVLDGTSLLAISGLG
jgi:hypothetical protein